MGVHQEHMKKQNKSKNYLIIGGEVKKGHQKYIALREDREIQSRELHEQTNIVLKSQFSKLLYGLIGFPSCQAIFSA